MVLGEDFINWLYCYFGFMNVLADKAAPSRPNPHHSKCAEYIKLHNKSLDPLDPASFFSDYP